MCIIQDRSPVIFGSFLNNDKILKLRCVAAEQSQRSVWHMRPSVHFKCVCVKFSKAFQNWTIHTHIYTDVYWQHIRHTQNFVTVTHLFDSQWMQCTVDLNVCIIVR